MKTRNENDQSVIVNMVPQANLQLPDPYLFGYYRDYNRRALWLEGEVNDTTMEICKEILRWNHEDIGISPSKRNPIILYINSPGGDLDIYKALADVIKLSKTPVIGVNMGCAMSAAAMIFMFCHKRYMMPNAKILFHQGEANMSGSFSTISAAMEAYEQDVAEIGNTILAHTKYTPEEVANNIITDWYIYADEALEKGVIDKIVEDINDIC